MPDWILLVFSGVLGAMVGSFLNVCILRLPAEESLLFPGSKCPKCEKPIAWYDNMPILSWIVLGGKCRNCKAAISAQYPFIEALTAGIWVAAAWHYGLTLTQGLCGPFASMRLGDAGAEIIKIEPLTGETSRTMGPPFIGDESAVFLSLNRNKKSVAVDLAKAEGQELVRKLIAQADVVLEDLGPGRAEKIGLGYEERFEIYSRDGYGCGTTWPA